MSSNYCRDVKLNGQIFNVPYRFLDTNKKKDIKSTARVIHAMKCRRGDSCPFKACSSIKNRMNVLSLVKIEHSTFFEHYKQCREAVPSPRMVCVCPLVRQMMKHYAVKSFLNTNIIPLSTFAICAIPIEEDLSLHPEGETVQSFRNAASRIQWAWRNHLRARGLTYRTMLCRIYCNTRSGGCRKGVNCVFAHERDDIRLYFSYRAESKMKSNFDEMSDFKWTIDFLDFLDF